MRALVITLLGVFLGVLNNDGARADRVDDLQEYSTSVPAVSNSNNVCGREPGFDWNKIEPNVKLTWVQCYTTDNECARLKVPLNYSEPNGRSAAIAMIRLRSPLFSSGSADYRGPILFNPGGPGGSGVDPVLRSGKLLSQLVGPQFDIVGFDPRGVDRSTPAASYFETAAERALWGGDSFESLNASTEALATFWARNQVIGRLAEENDRDKDILAHINTENTARDMLQIIQAYGQDKIHYWGFSYGTILGMMFASLFPDRVDRMVLDGVADAEGYFAGLWSNSLRDTDKALQYFFENCVAAGPDGCPFYAPTAANISQNLQALYDRIHAQPVPVFGHSNSRNQLDYGVVDYSMLRGLVFSSLYSPYASFPRLAAALSALAMGDGTGIFELANAGRRFQCHCDSSVQPFEHIDDASTVIACTDAEEMRDSVEESRVVYKDMRRISEWADLYGGLRMKCSAWPKQEKRHYQGPFIGNTSHPILFIGNTADPVCPVWNAHKMSKGFPGSVVLTQDSPGHCSIAAPSLCTQRYIRQYFENGTVPASGTVCSVKEPIFASATGEDEQQMRFQVGLSEDDRKLYGAIQAISRSGSFLYHL